MKIRSHWIVALLTVGLVLTACRGSESREPPVHLNPNMDNQDKYKPYRASNFFKDGRSMRTPPQGTLPQNKLAEQSLDYKIKSRSRSVTSAESFYTGKTGKVYTAGVPFALDISDLERGRDRYAIYCTPCHGISGYGNGTVADRSRGKLMPSNFHTAPGECRPQAALEASLERLKASAELARESAAPSQTPSPTSDVVAAAEAPQPNEPTTAVPPSEEAAEAPADPANAWKSEAFLGAEGYASLLELEQLMADPSGGCGQGSICVANTAELPSDNTQLEGQCQRTMGWIYHVITHGIRSMGGYEHQMTDPTDRWAVAAYVRALQLSQSVDRNGVVDVLSAQYLAPPEQTAVFEQLDKGGEYTFTQTQKFVPTKGAKK